jgi:hypothetical protein
MLGVFEITMLAVDAMWQQASCGMQDQCWQERGQ